MRLSFTPRGWNDDLALRSENASAHAKRDSLIAECRRHAFKGTGIPEPLKDNLKGWRSRRLSCEHRLVYRVYGSSDAQMLEISQCRFHYSQ